MEGKFMKRIAPVMYIFLGLCLLALGVAVFMFLKWEMGSGVRALLLGVCGLFFLGWLAFIVALYYSNRGAYLKLSEDGIQARYGFGTTLACTLQDVNYAAMGPSMLSLEVSGKIHDIAGLTNASEIATWLKNQIPFIVPKESRAQLMAQKAKHLAQRKNWLIALVAAVVMVFVAIFVAKGATGSRSLSQFTSRDLMVIAIFIFAEIALITGAFLFARKAGKCIRYNAVCHDKLRCLAFATTELPEGNAIGVFYNGFSRLTLYADPLDRIYYQVETLTKGLTLQVTESCEPTSDTWEIDQRIDQMRDIGFLFGLD